MHPSFIDALLFTLQRNSQVLNYPETVRELIRCLKPGGMLILGEGDGECNVEDQVTFAEPADPNIPDQNQRGKTWVIRKAHGMYSSPYSAPLDTILSAYLTNVSLVLLQRS